MNFERVLREVGEFGRYQMFLFALFCCPVCIFISYVIFGQLFISLEPDHWCNVPELDNANWNLTDYEKKLLSLPTEFRDGTITFSQCQMYDVNYSQVLNLMPASHEGMNMKKWTISFGETTFPNSSWKKVPCRHGWRYNFTEYYPTAVSEWDWVCGDNWRPYLAQSVFFIGCTVGCLLFGVVADMYGRVPALFMSNFVACTAGVATAFSTGFISFVVFRFLAGMSFNTCFLAFYIIVLEYTGPSKRTLISNISFGVFHCLSAMFIPWVAYAVWDWRLFAIVTSAPIGIILPLCLVIPESASWLLARGKVDKALKIIDEMAKFNKRQLSPALAEDLKRTLKESHNRDFEEKRHTLLDVLRSPVLRKRTLLMFTVWFLISLCADGHARNTHNLGYSIYYTFMTSSATQLPAGIIVLFTLDRLGRRWSAFLSLVIGGGVCLSIAAVPFEMNWVMVSLAMVGRLMINVSFNIGLQYAPELLPTVVRGQGVSATHLIGFIANILSPFVVYLAKFSMQLPLLVFGGLSVIGAVLCLFLPETLYEHLPHTLEDAEHFARDQSFFYFPSCSKKKESPSATPIGD